MERISRCCFNHVFMIRLSIVRWLDIYVPPDVTQWEVHNITYEVFLLEVFDLNAVTCQGNPECRVFCKITGLGCLRIQCHEKEKEVEGIYLDWWRTKRQQSELSCMKLGKILDGKIQMEMTVKCIFGHWGNFSSNYVR